MENKKEMTPNELEHITAGEKGICKLIFECPVCHHHFQVDMNASVGYCPYGHKVELKG